VVATSIPSAAFCDAHDTEGCIKQRYFSYCFSVKL